MILEIEYRKIHGRYYAVGDSWEETLIQWFGPDCTILCGACCIGKKKKNKAFQTTIHTRFREKYTITIQPKYL